MASFNVSIAKDTGDTGDLSMSQLMLHLRSFTTRWQHSDRSGQQMEPFEGLSVVLSRSLSHTENNFIKRDFKTIIKYTVVV